LYEFTGVAEETWKRATTSLLRNIQKDFKDEAQTALFKDPVRTAL
jgi:hypothetical protein